MVTENMKKQEQKQSRTRNADFSHVIFEAE